MIGALLCLVIGAWHLPSSTPQTNSLTLTFTGPIWLALVLGGVAILFGLAGLVYSCVILHRMWWIIQAPEQKVTPGRAVGFLFIPFFNLYWLFVAYWRWSTDYNRFVEQHAILGVPRMPEGIFMGFCIALLSYLVLGCPALIPYIGLSVYKTYQVAEAVNAFHRFSDA